MAYSTLELIQNHRSIRKFTDAPISPEMLHAIIQSAQHAASSSFMQCVTLLRITSKALREPLIELTGNQPYVASAPEFLLFCADFNRHQQIAPKAQLGYVEQLLTASIDAGLMGQNALLAAQSLGLGGVFIGGIRNHPQKVCALFALPEHVFPLFGLCLGWPDQNPEIKPRLPESLVLHENQYQPVDFDVLNQYDTVLHDYYQHRTGNPRDARWSTQITEKLLQESRPFMLECLQRQGFCKK